MVGLRSWSAPSPAISQALKARRPGGVSTYCWDARGPRAPRRSSPASASTGSSRYTWLRVTEKNAP